MAIYVEAKEAVSKAPVGQFQAVCCETLDLGFKERVYKNKETGLDEKVNTHEIQYVFQINKIDPETGKRYEIRSAPFNLKLSEKANLRKFLLQWRGHDLTPEELRPPGVNVDLTGRNCLLQIIENKVGDKVYSNIGSIMPLMEGMPEIQPLNYQSKQQFVNQAQAAAGGGGLGGAQTPMPSQAMVDSVPKADDDIPF